TQFPSLCSQGLNKGKKDKQYAQRYNLHFLTLLHNFDNMFTSKVIYLGDLRANAVHLRSGHQIETDAPTDNRGKGEKFSPTDLTATSLASCILTTIGIYCQDHDIDIQSSNADVLKIMSTEGPRRIIGIQVEVTIRTKVELDEKQKTILERVGNTCPVALSLHPDIKQDISFSFALQASV